MKKIILALLCVVLIGCDTFNPIYTFKVIGNDDLIIYYADDDESIQWSGKTQSFNKELKSGEIYFLQVQPIKGSGCTGEVYLGNTLLRRIEVKGLDVVRIFGYVK